MRKARHRLVLGALCAALAQIPSSAAAPEVSLDVTCQCVRGGVNNNLVLWMRGVIIPRFESASRAAGTPARVNLIEFGDSNEALKRRYALDLRVRRGSDLLYFDQFWVPEFASGGLIKPLRDIAGSEIDRWDGWAKIPPTLRSLFEYRGAL